MKKGKLDVIVCPHCGMEYLPAEIFIPSSFVGKPKNIEKDSVGKINSFVGISSDTVEDFVCDGCGNPFKVIAKIQYQSVAKEKFNFNTEHTTRLKQASIVLPED